MFGILWRVKLTEVGVKSVTKTLCSSNFHNSSLEVVSNNAELT